MSLRGSPIRRLQLFSKQSNSQILALNAEIERLNSQIHSKNVQIKSLYDENTLMKLNYEQQISSYVSAINILQEKLKSVQISRGAEFSIIKQKYDRLAAEESENMKSYHSHEIQFLMKQIANLRVDCAAKDEKILIKQKQILTMAQSYERQLQQKINEINSLNKNLLSIEDTKNKQIKQINTKRELQKSRTSGVLSSRKQNNQFMDKQIRKLNQEILQKAIKIQNLGREANKIKRKSEETEKALTKKIQDLIAQKQEETKERQEHFAKIQKSLKQEILQFKSKQLKYLGEIDTMKSSIDTYKSEIQIIQQKVKSKQEEIGGYKQLLNKQREDHAKEISNLMKQRKRRSSNLGSSRSLSSSLRDAGVSSNQEQPNSTNHQPTATVLKKMDSIRLATVKQQSPDKSMSRSIDRSNLTQGQGEQQNQLIKVIYHYDTLIEQLKRSYSSQKQLLQHKINKLTKGLDQKQQELLDMLKRFSPLVTIHAGEKSVQQDRKQRIQNHWKADVGILQIMLQKYKIKTFE